MKITIFFPILFFVCSIIILTNACEKQEPTISDPCEGVVCQNDSECIDGTCDCNEGYIGTNCENFDPAAVQDLLNDGRTPIELYNAGIPLDSIYGKVYNVLLKSKTEFK